MVIWEYPWKEERMAKKKKKTKKKKVKAKKKKKRQLGCGLGGFDLVRYFFRIAFDLFRV